MNLLLLTFGARPENHHQAVFSVLSFFRDPVVSSVMVMTDQPEMYRWLSTQAARRVDGRELPPLEIIPVDPATLAEWQGRQQFFWRIKIKAIEQAIGRYPGQHLVYVDSDTFMANNLAAVSRLLDQGSALMHCQEYRLGECRDQTVVQMNRLLSGRQFADVPVTPQSWMWNAGVVGLPACRAAELLQLTLQVCDGMCATEAPRRLIEQFAFSVALDHAAALHPCESTIGHYWGNKPEWNQFILRFLAENRLRDDGLGDIFARLARMDWSRMPLETRPHGPVERIKRGLDRLLPPNEGRYFAAEGAGMHG